MMKSTSGKIFLEAEWRKLVMANYVVDSPLLKKYLPPKTELELWNNGCYVSLVGFMFRNTRVKGFRIPFHVNFEEVNLRFYVRYNDGDEWKRGVVFIKEIVPKPALTWVANTVYNEKYETMPMRHEWKISPDALAVKYQWKRKKWHSLEVTAKPTAGPVLPGSEEEFIIEHYWGYTKAADGKTSEYNVQHPKWEVYPVVNHKVDVDFADVYGKDFSVLNGREPESVFLAEGSEISVMEGKII